MTIPMLPDLLTLAQWLSPSFPISAFAYSHGLEQAVADGRVSDAGALQDWLRDVLEHSTGHSDATLIACAHRANADELSQIDATARAFAPSAERRLETVQQGASFAATIRAIWEFDLPDMAYPVALGRAAALQGLEAQPVAALYLHSFAANLVACAQRLMPLGQTDGQRILHDLKPLCTQIAADTAAQTLDDLASCAFLSDITAMRHETLQPRIFRT